MCVSLSQIRLYNVARTNGCYMSYSVCSGGLLFINVVLEMGLSHVCVGYIEKDLDDA